jgi:hypothetical protein
MTTPTPPESLLQYGEPIFTREVFDASNKHNDEAQARFDSTTRIEDVLNAMLPPQYVPTFCRCSH